MTILTTALTSVLNGGDLGIEGWLKLLVILFFLTVVPLFLIGFYHLQSRDERITLEW